MPSGVPLTAAEERLIVAMLARGDLMRNIQEHFHNHMGRDVARLTIINVKKRNKDNLAIIEQRLVAKAEQDALGNKTTANRTIGKELSLNERKVDMLAKIHDDYINGEINLEEFDEQARKIKRASLTELVSVSKEMHNQTTEEKPKGNPEDIAKLLEALNSGDEVRLQQMIWGGKDDSSIDPDTVPTTDIPNSGS